MFSTTLLLYKLDTLLLKQKNLPVLDITGFFFRIRTQVTYKYLYTVSLTNIVLQFPSPFHKGYCTANFNRMTKFFLSNLVLFSLQPHRKCNG